MSDPAVTANGSAEQTATRTITELLRATKIQIAPAAYVLLGLSSQDWSRLLAEPELSPRHNAPFMIFRDSDEVTLLIEEDDWMRIRHGVRDAKVERDFKLITFDTALPWNVVGYLARITELLAQAGIPVGVLSSFSRDHLLIKQQYLGKALRALGPHVGELCG